MTQTQDEAKLLEVPDGYMLEPIRSEFGRLIGPIYTSITPSASEVRLAFRCQKKHGNTNGVTHGGMICTFMDGILASTVRLATNDPIATVRLITDFTGPARIGALVEGRGTMTRATRNLVYVRGEIWTGHHSVATGSAVFRILSRERSARLAAGN